MVAVLSAKSFVMLSTSVHSFSASTMISQPSHHARDIICHHPLIESLHNNDHRRRSNSYATKLSSAENGEDDIDSSATPSLMGDSESTLLGISGIIASVVMLYSESVLFQTGCGLPAGPFGLVSATEGISYLGVVALVGYSLLTKIRTGNGLPAGPSGIVGAAEGLAYLAIFAGFWVLIAQVTNFGYIPNAVPIEGAMCQ